jgi:hypothetical protein
VPSALIGFLVIVLAVLAALFIAPRLGIQS